MMASQVLHPSGSRAAADLDPIGSIDLPVGILAIQGSFSLHQQAFERLRTPCRLVRAPRDLRGISALVVPGGESTTMSLLLRDYGMFETVRDLGRDGLPMFGTCAGAILLGRGAGIPPRLELAPVELERNAYGTQVDSFTSTVRIAGFQAPFRAIFIRAPRIVGVGEGAEVLARQDGDPVLVASGSLLLSTFHPELTDDLRVHAWFLRRFVVK